jgi:hypothetical protein
MITIVICSIDAAKFQAIQRNFATLLAGEPYELLGVHDARSLCEGYNRGVAHARPETQTFVFCHDDIEILSPDFAAKLKGHLRQFDLVGVAGTDRLISALWSEAGPPHIHGQVAHYNAGERSLDVEIFSTPARAVGNIQALDGLFFAARRRVVERLRFDEQTFDGWHGYDIDYTFAAHRAGFRVGVACDIAVTHASIGRPDEVWRHYGERFVRKYQGQLAPPTGRAFQVMAVRTRSRDEALDVMTPRYWPPREATT